MTATLSFIYGLISCRVALFGTAKSIRSKVLKALQMKLQVNCSNAQMRPLKTARSRNFARGRQAANSSAELRQTEARKYGTASTPEGSGDVMAQVAMHGAYSS